MNIQVLFTQGPSVQPEEHTEIQAYCADHTINKGVACTFIELRKYFAGFYEVFGWLSYF